MALSNQSGQLAERYGYTPYGKRRVVSPGGATLAASAVGNQVGFTGRYHDGETGLTYFRARYQDAELGRFVGRDPIAFGDFRRTSDFGFGVAIPSRSEIGRRNAIANIALPGAEERPLLQQRAPADMSLYTYASGRLDPYGTEPCEQDCVDKVRQQFDGVITAHGQQIQNCLDQFFACDDQARPGCEKQECIDRHRECVRAADEAARGWEDDLNGELENKCGCVINVA